MINEFKHNFNSFIINLRMKNIQLYEIIVFGLVGGTGFIIDTTVFSLLIHFFRFGSHWYLIAQTLSFICAVTNNFYLNKWITFQVKGDLGNQYVKFFLISFLCYLVRSAIIFLLVDIMNFQEITALIVSIISVACFNFWGAKFWAFR